MAYRIYADLPISINPTRRLVSTPVGSTSASRGGDADECLPLALLIVDNSHLTDESPAYVAFLLVNRFKCYQALTSRWWSSTL
ncbi:hypothetical protein [Nocardia barduliensis]|uniref:hypothetical protein n=1 Tax=Nocardia barduliensis TaxID=2736643 RepID=UPI0015735A0E|nr:hypothetical protein [Nocardia barduliensis]